MSARPAIAPARPAKSASADGEGRSDQENLALIEQHKGVYDGLRADQIRNEHDLKQSEQAVADALKAAKTEFGVDSVDQLREMLVENRNKNTQATDAWVETVQRVQLAVDEADGKR